MSLPKRKLTKHPGGRPTKYIPSIIYPKIDEYFQTVGREQTELPTIEGFSEFLGVNDDTVVEWAKKHRKFSATIKKVMSKQKIQLMNDGMYGGKEVNQAMAIFLLKVNHGMREKEADGNVYNQQNIYMNLTDEQLEKLIQEKARDAGYSELVGGEEEAD